MSSRLCPTKIIDGGPVPLSLAEEVRAKLLFEARRHRNQRRHPVRLRGLRRRRDGKPVRKKSFRSGQGSGRRTADAGQIGQIPGGHGQRCDSDTKGQHAGAYLCATLPEFGAPWPARIAAIDSSPSQFNELRRIIR